MTGRGKPLLRGVVCGLMTMAGGIGHTMPYLIQDFHTATAVVAVIVAVELLALAISAITTWIRRFFPLVSKSSSAARWYSLPEFSSVVREIAGVILTGHAEFLALRWRRARFNSNQSPSCRCCRGGGRSPLFRIHRREFRRRHYQQVSDGPHPQLEYRSRKALWLPAKGDRRPVHNKANSSSASGRRTTDSKTPSSRRTNRSF
jgi:hypothetical protein